MLWLLADVFLPVRSVMPERSCQRGPRPPAMQQSRKEEDADACCVSCYALQLLAYRPGRKWSCLDRAQHGYHMGDSSRRVLHIMESPPSWCCRRGHPLTGQRADLSVWLGAQVQQCQHSLPSSAGCRSWTAEWHSWRNQRKSCIGTCLHIAQRVELPGANSRGEEALASKEKQWPKARRRTDVTCRSRSMKGSSPPPCLFSVLAVLA
mmetsp:Transcript_58086/g.138177  ORF Transcript_58086/g.138177 Transcript_58086/m.138177 type:complete len:207 (-) Transcript_58086:239-859(-)